MLLLFALGCPGGDSAKDDTGTVPSLPDLPTNRACLIPATAAPEDVSMDAYTIEVAGLVTETGSGDPPTGCRDREEWLGRAVVAWDDAPTYWLRIRAADDTEWIAAATNPMLLDPAPLLDTSLIVSYRSVLGEPMAGQAAETQVDFQSDQMRFWLGNAGSLDVLDPWPDVAFTVGAEEGAWTDECGRHTRFALHASRGDEAGDVPTGEVEGFDGIGVWSGGVETYTELTCADVLGGVASLYEYTLETRR